MVPSSAPDGVFFDSGCSLPRVVSFSRPYLFHFGFKPDGFVSLNIFSSRSDTLRLLKGCSIRPFRPHFVKDQCKRMFRKWRRARKRMMSIMSLDNPAGIFGDQMTRNADDSRPLDHEK